MASPSQDLEAQLESLNLGEANGIFGLFSRTPSLKTSASALAEAASGINEEALQLKSLATILTSTDSISLEQSNDIAKQVEAVHATTQSLGNKIKELRENLEEDLVKQFLGLGTGPNDHKDWEVVHLLQHFQKTIRDVAHSEIMASTTLNYSDVVAQVAKRWRHEASDEDGSLHTDVHYHEVDERAMGYPYDEDFESEEYYEHENRIHVDEDYAARWRRNDLLRNEQTRKLRCETQAAWCDYWARIELQCPGPTLFDSGTDLDLDNIPRYLFRTVDRSSQGVNNENLIASRAAQKNSPSGKISLLAMEPLESVTDLFAHFTQLHQPTNLVSWTSSLLFALQYAVYKATTNNSDPGDIKIFVLDTSSFPQGQFVQDVTLMEKYQQFANAQQLSFFNFRLRESKYYNGEYLSQGTIRLRGRVCIASLKDLEDNGLGDIYPELRDPAGAGSWTNRVKQLREEVWQVPTATNEREIDQALKLVRTCFSGVNVLELTMLLLCLRPRVFTNCEGDPLDSDSPWFHRPIEVGRYLRAMDAVRETSEQLRHCQYPEMILRFVLQSPSAFISARAASSTPSLSVV